LSDPFTPAWLARDPRALPFLERGFDDPVTRARAVDAARARPIDRALLEAWAAQEARRPASEARREGLARLAEGAVAVVTGQQVGLFLGPLYTLHKAAAAVADARALAAEAGHPAVPVFWLQTEDHDFAEVRAAALPGLDAPTSLTVADHLEHLPERGQRTSLAHRPLGPSLADAHAALAATLQGPHAADVTALLARHYRPERTFGEAMGDTLAELFADHGLLVLDPRDPALAPFSRPVHRLAITRAAALADALATRARALHDAGFEVQVKVRELALSCHHEGGPEGPRQRVALGRDDLLAELDAQPFGFSTTALLRPLLQDTWLPTAAYLGGPGELAYFAELAPVYAAAERAMPLAVPRARFRLMTPAARRLGEQLGLAPDDARRPLAELERALASRAAADHDPVGDAARAFDAALTASLAALRAHAEAHRDHGFVKAAHKSEEQMRHAFERLVERARHAALEADRVTHERLLRWRGLVAPGGQPQERVLGFMHAAAQVGPRALVDRLVAAVVPFDGALREVDL